MDAEAQVEAVRRGWDLVGRGELDELMTLYHPEAEFRRAISLEHGGGEWILEMAEAFEEMARGLTADER